MTESKIEQQRRAWVEKQERFRDIEKDFDARRAAAPSPEERDRITRAFAAQRRLHREEAIAAGKRSPSLAIGMRQVVWARWFEIAVEHELEARDAYHDLVARRHSEPLVREFRAALIAVTAAAHTVEAVFGEIKYLIPSLQRARKRHQLLRNGFAVAFGTSTSESHRLGDELAWLFALRDSAVHPYTEMAAPEPHPAGINTGAEHMQFNAVTCGRAVDIAREILGHARLPPNPHCGWITRSRDDRAAYHQKVVDPLLALRVAAPPVP